MFERHRNKRPGFSPEPKIGAFVEKPEINKEYNGVKFKTKTNRETGERNWRASQPVDKDHFVSFTPEDWVPKKDVGYKVQLTRPIADPSTSGHLGRWACIAVQQAEDERNFQKQKILDHQERVYREAEKMSKKK